MLPSHPEFGQSVFIVDCIWELFVLVGSAARGRRLEIRLALTVADVGPLSAPYLIHLISVCSSTGTGMEGVVYAAVYATCSRPHLPYPDTRRPSAHLPGA